MEDKRQLRQKIAAKKKNHSQDELFAASCSIQKHIESLDFFRQSQTVLLYHSLPDEVQTIQMLQDWYPAKNCLLPQIRKNEMILKRYNGEIGLQKGQLGIWEPSGDIFTDFEKIDLVIVPGMAFDKDGNRLGRGKGYYDRLLSKISATTIGICFDFQLVEKIPVETHDVPMEYVLTPSALYHQSQTFPLFG